jgi:transcriptional regulator with XRE-family HTH domain
MRRRRGFSVTGLALATGFSHAYVSRLEGGDLRPSSRYRRAVAKALALPEDVIFGAEEQE